MGCHRHDVIRCCCAWVTPLQVLLKKEQEAAAGHSDHSPTASTKTSAAALAQTLQPNTPPPCPACAVKAASMSAAREGLEEEVARAARLERVLDAERVRSQTLSQQLSDALHEVAGMRADLDVVQAELEDVMHDRRRMQGRAADMAAQLRDAGEVAAVGEARVQRLEGQLACEMSKAESAAGQVAGMQGEVARLKGELASAQEKAAAAGAVQPGLLSGLQAQMSVLLEDIKEANRRASAAEAGLAVVTTEKEGLLRELGKAGDKRATLQKLVEAGQARVAAVQGEAKARMERAAQLHQSQLDELSAQHGDQVDGLRAEYDSRVDMLRKELSADSARRADMESKIQVG
jgi:chromosome segregation ATPase